MDVNSKNDFYMVLESNSSYKYFSSNTSSNFKIMLPQRIDLENNFEVALVEVHIPGNWNNVSQNNLYYKTYSIDIRNNEKHFFELNKIIISAGRYSTDEFFIKLNYGLNNPDVTFAYENSSNKCSIRLNSKIKVELSNNLSKILGFEMNTLINESSESAIISAKYSFNLSSQMNSIYIYCNLVENQITSDIFSPLLRVIHIDQELKLVKKNSITKTFSYPFYIPLCYKKFQTIEINIRNTLGELLEFSSTSHCILTLHFKKK